jgi:hypothetical protein
MQIKSFTDERPDNSVNEWLSKNPTIQVVNMFINTAACATEHSRYFFHTITIVYRELVTPATANQPAVYE